MPRVGPNTITRSFVLRLGCARHHSSLNFTGPRASMISTRCEIFADDYLMLLCVSVGGKWVCPFLPGTFEAQCFTVSCFSFSRTIRSWTSLLQRSSSASSCFKCNANAGLAEIIILRLRLRERTLSIPHELFTHVTISRSENIWVILESSEGLAL